MPTNEDDCALTIVNGSLNILRKYLTAKVAWNNQLWFDCVERCSNETILKVNVA